MSRRKHGLSGGGAITRWLVAFSFSFNLFIPFKRGTVSLNKPNVQRNFDNLNRLVRSHS